MNGIKIPMFDLGKVFPSDEPKRVQQIRFLVACQVIAAIARLLHLLPNTSATRESKNPAEEVPRARPSLGRGEGKCSRQNLKPFVVDPVGPSPTRQGLATHRKRVLRRVGVTRRFEA